MNKGIVDLHSHLLPIDDGVYDLKESLPILKEAYRHGVRTVFVTPHYMIGSYDCNNQEKERLFHELKTLVQQEGIDLQLYLGNEVFVENNLLELIKENKIKTLNDSRYLLIEVPRLDVYNGLLDLIFELKSMGIEPILAHPERYKMIMDDVAIAKELKEHGLYFQCNIGSFVGVYGKHVQKCVMTLLKHNCIDFLGSDVHHLNHCHYKHLENVKKILKKYLKPHEVDEILLLNGQKVIQNEEIIMKEVIPFKKTLIERLKGKR